VLPKHIEALKISLAHRGLHFADDKVDSVRLLDDGTPIIVDRETVYWIRTPHQQELLAPFMKMPLPKDYSWVTPTGAWKQHEQFEHLYLSTAVNQQGG
jgi:hypothetical protein